VGLRIGLRQLGEQQIAVVLGVEQREAVLGRVLRRLAADPALERDVHRGHRLGYAEQVEAFLEQAPRFEELLVEDGILLFKYWLTCDQEEQEERLRERAEDPLKRWKLSPIDLVAREKYKAYTKAREVMLDATHTRHAPWTLVDFNDQHRGRLTVIRDLLDRLPEVWVDPPDVEFEPLGHEPEKEKFAVVKPIKSYRD
jgi:hypothetical protein